MRPAPQFAVFAGAEANSRVGGVFMTRGFVMMGTGGRRPALPLHRQRRHRRRPAVLRWLFHRQRLITKSRFCPCAELLGTEGWELRTGVFIIDLKNNGKCKLLNKLHLLLLLYYVKYRNLVKLSLT